MKELNEDYLADFAQYELDEAFEANPFIKNIIKTIEDEFDKVNKGLSEEERNFFPAFLGKENSEKLYNIIRQTEPEIVVETGVCNGLSTAVILKAMQDNEKGELHSVDLPLTTENGKKGAIIPAGKSPGWAVPEDLRTRWHLFEGNTFYKLPVIMEQLSQRNLKVDMFLHDSEHTIEGMLFEYALAWKHLKEDGLLLSDNIDSAAAFKVFADVQEVQKYYISDMGLLIKSR